jgi:hypothetical protein
LFASYVLKRFLSSLLWGVSSNDSSTYVAAVILIVATGAAACFLPSPKGNPGGPVKRYSM